MSKIVTEKFEVRNPQNRNEEKLAGRWVSDASARQGRNRIRRPEDSEGKRKMMPGMHNKRAHHLDTRLNYLPPGMDIEAQSNADIREMGFTTSGSMPRGGAEGDRTQEINPRSLREGFHRRPLRPTDDQWTREHNDAFYDTIEVDGNVGFCERNNYCDRS